jgi:hypothetical protein
VYSNVVESQCTAGTPILKIQFLLVGHGVGIHCYDDDERIFVDCGEKQKKKPSPRS